MPCRFEEDNSQWPATLDDYELHEICGKGASATVSAMSAAFVLLFSPTAALPGWQTSAARDLQQDSMLMGPGKIPRKRREVNYGHREV